MRLSTFCGLHRDTEHSSYTLPKVTDLSPTLLSFLATDSPSTSGYWLSSHTSPHGMVTDSLHTYYPMVTNSLLIPHPETLLLLTGCVMTLLLHLTQSNDYVFFWMTVPYTSHHWLLSFSAHLISGFWFSTHRSFQQLLHFTRGTGSPHLPPTLISNLFTLLLWLTQVTDSVTLRNISTQTRDSPKPKPRILRTLHPLLITGIWPLTTSYRKYVLTSCVKSQSKSNL